MVVSDLAGELPTLSSVGSSSPLIHPSLPIAQNRLRRPPSASVDLGTRFIMVIKKYTTVLS